MLPTRVEAALIQSKLVVQLITPQFTVTMLLPLTAELIPFHQYNSFGFLHLR